MAFVVRQLIALDRCSFFSNKLVANELFSLLHSVNVQLK